MLHPGTPPARTPVFLFDPAITLDSLRSSADTLIQGFPQAPKLPQVQVRKILSLEEAIENLSTRVSSAFRVSFREFSGMNKERSAEIKHSVIVSFLALLELVKQGIIKANQGEHFGDISLEPDSISTPTYE